MTREELEKQAALLGCKPDTLRMRIYRETLRRKTKPEPPAFDTFGMRLTPKFTGQVRDVRRRLEQLARQVASTRLAVERLLRSKLPVPQVQLETIEGAVLSLEDRISAAMPRSLCPYCKGLDQLQDDCRGCNGAGMLSAAQFNQAPRRLKDEPVVICEGKEQPLSDFAADPKRDPFEG
jgi:hypothetical protein